MREESLRLEAVSGRVLRINGEIACRGGIVIRVTKFLEMLDDEDPPLVQTFQYAYHATVRGYGSLIRHDNSHAHNGHTDEHHRHLFDWRTDQERPGSPEWVGMEGWPTLGDFIRIVETWYWENRDALPDADGYPEIGIGFRES